jgi:hypothetical protein
MCAREAPGVSLQNVTSREAGIDTMATFVVEDGRLGAQRA